VQELYQWAQRWAIPARALQELTEVLGKADTPPDPDYRDKSESFVQDQQRLFASQCGARVWRNNVGAFKPETGGFVRYGLCNDTKALNKQLKSSDLIGIRPVLITPERVGTTIGQFVALEVKESNWKWRNTEREQAQLRYISLVASLGGFARFIRRAIKWN